MRDLRALLAGPRALLAASDARVLRLQIRLAEIPAPTGAEGERAAFVARAFRRAGYTRVEVDAAGNVRALRLGAASLAPVAVCAHLDTVFPAGTVCRVQTVGTRLIGPGIGDNGRGLAGMLAIAAALADPRLPLRRPLIFAATTGEEGDGDLRGAKHLFQSFPEAPDAAVVIDGPGDSRIVHHAVGVRRFRITFSGIGGHSWSSFGLANPVHAAAEAAARIASWNGSRAGRTTLSVTRIAGGTAVNAIPAEGWLDIDCRALDPASLADADRAVRRAAGDAAASENSRRAAGADPLTVRVAVTGDRPCGITPRSSSLVTRAYAATRVVGRAPVTAAASTDANVPLALGISAIAIGAGGHGGGAHTPDEWYDNSMGSVGLERALLIVASAAA